MGASVNTWVVSGKLVKDPEVKKSKSGKRFTTARLEYTTGWGDNFKTSRVGILAFGDIGEKLYDRGSEGTAILLQASVEVKTTKKDGKYETFVNVTAKEIEFLDDLAGESEDVGQKAYKNAYEKPAVDDDDDDEEIPF